MAALDVQISDLATPVTGGTRWAFFRYRGLHQVRVFMDEIGTPFFIATDVFDAAEKARKSYTGVRHQLGVKETRTVQSPGVFEPKPITVLSDCAVFYILSRSGAGEVRKFLAWVANEVMPWLRAEYKKKVIREATR